MKTIELSGDEIAILGSALDDYREAKTKKLAEPDNRIEWIKTLITQYDKATAVAKKISGK